MQASSHAFRTSRRSGELPFRLVTAAGVMIIVATLVAITLVLLEQTSVLWPFVDPLTFLTSGGWSEVESPAGEITASYGALPMLWGTLVTSIIGILVAAPIGIAAAIYLVEIAPKRLAIILTFLVEVVAAIPSVVVGLWALSELSPRLRDSIEWWIASTLGRVVPWLSEDSSNPANSSVFRAGIVLAIMVTPLVSALSREVIRSVPQSLREGLVGMGATKWETIRLVILPTARAGLVSAVILAFGRAIGETVAVVLVIGGGATLIPPSLFQPGSTLAGQIAISYGDAGTVGKGALAGLGLVLLGLTLVLSTLARLMLSRSNRQGRS